MGDIQGAMSMRHLSVWTKHCSGFPPPATFACALKCCVPPRTCHSPKAHDIVAISPTPQLTTSSPLRIEALEISSSRRPGLERFLMPWSARPHGGGGSVHREAILTTSEINVKHPPTLLEFSGEPGRALCGASAAQFQLFFTGPWRGSIKK